MFFYDIIQKKMKKGIQMKKSRIVIIILAVFVVCGLGAVVYFTQLKPAYEQASQKELTHCEGMLSITLPKAFTKRTQNVAENENTYESTYALVSILCNSNDFLRKNHYSVNNATEYAEVYISQHGNGFTSEIYSDQSFPYVEIEEKIQGEYYKTLIAFYKGSDGYYNVYFSCPEYDYYNHRDDFLAWANTVVMN